MTMHSAAAAVGWTSLEILRWGREIVHREGQTLVDLAGRLESSFCQAVDLIYDCRGAVLVIGMGKAGLIGQKISATFCSTGTRSFFIHPAEAIHGDLGRVHQDDLALILSQSGETAEIVRILPSLAEFDIQTIAITGRAGSTLGQSTTVVLELGSMEEAGPNRLAPSSSTTAMLAVGDALALVVSRLRGFGPADFARFHPGGNLGLRLAKVDDVMRSLAECRVAADSERVRDVFVAASRPGRRTGAIMLTDADGRLSGIFTDSDLARLLEHRHDQAIDEPIRDLMTARPTTVVSGMELPKAVDILASRKISELPVVDTDGRPLGLLDITDVVALLPHEPEPEAPTIMPFEKK